MIYFWSDPHLGLNRTSHTTVASRKALREALFNQAMKMPGHSFCLGDLFDTSNNDEDTIWQGYRVSKTCLVLAGNHDSTNRDSKLSSLSALALIDGRPGSFIHGDGDTCFDYEIGFDDAVLYSIPHKRTQILFDETLQAALTKGRVNKAVRPLVLLLHCNYDSAFADNDTSLNLTRDQAKQLLDVFDYVLIGHEHIARADFGGRLQILGNIHPTSFSDISDKYLWKLEDGRLSSELIWSTDNYLKLDWEHFLSDALDSHIEFLEIVGTAPASKMPEIARRVQKFWSDHPETYMVKNAVKTETIEVVTVTTSKALDVPSKITAMLEDTKLKPIWEHYLEQVK